jgi:secreted PhoX family phosphatase
VLASPDNLTVHPKTGVVILCEDGGFLSRRRLSGITKAGRLFQFGEQSTTEFAGACFSPDGRWLFVNLQGRATTYAITGPWERGVLGQS